jgi:tetratricopeptide (TPR) repeat protein
MSCAVAAADTRAASHLYGQAAALNERCREPFWDHVLLSYAIGAAFDAADFAEAEAAAERASRPADAGSDSWTEPEGLYGLRMFQIRREQGRLDEVAPLLTLLARTGQQALWRPGLALLLVELGRLEEATAHFDAIVGNDYAGISHDDNRLLHLCFTAEVCAALERAVEARWLEAELASVAGRCICLTGSGLRLGPGDRYLGLMRAAQNDVAGARSHLGDALALARRSGSVVWTARVLADLAVVCGDRAAAAESGDLAQRHGLVAVARRMADAR